MNGPIPDIFRLSLHFMSIRLGLAGVRFRVVASQACCFLKLFVAEFARELPHGHGQIVVGLEVGPLRGFLGLLFLALPWRGVDRLRLLSHGQIVVKYNCRCCRHRLQYQRHLGRRREYVCMLCWHRFSFLAGDLRQEQKSSTRRILNNIL